MLTARVRHKLLMTQAVLWPKPQAQLKQHKNSQFFYFSHKHCKAKLGPRRTLKAPRSKIQKLVIKTTGATVIVMGLC